jgi:arylsulfatase A-like enzyme
MDVTPTLLHSLGVSLNDRFDGQVLEPVLATDREQSAESYPRFDSDSVDELTEQEETNLRNRLQGMGYLE